MPVPIAAKVGIVAASVAVAAAIAIYEIPEVRRAAETVRRRIAIALHSLGENVDPDRPPRFNRPEDANGFYQSHSVDADEETRRMQREELLYWNMRREEQERRRQSQGTGGSTFDDFLKPDRAGDSGTFVYNTGADVWDADSSTVLRRRGNAEGVRGLNASLLANPFSDEHGIELDEQIELLSPPRDEVMSDIYDATPRLQSPAVAPVEPRAVQPVSVPVAAEVLFDFATHAPFRNGIAADATKEHATATTTTRSTTLDRDLADDEYMTAGQADRAPADVYAAIQAWAQNSSAAATNNHSDAADADHNPGFYSPLPSTPRAPVSEPEFLSAGQLTPTTNASVAGSGVDVAAAMSVAGVEGEGDDDRRGGFDVMSVTDAGSGSGGIATPNSWSEVGSVVSESESVMRA